MKNCKTAKIRHTYAMQNMPESQKKEISNRYIP